jgi:hypothetical protein
MENLLDLMSQNHLCFEKKNLRPFKRQWIPYLIIRYQIGTDTDLVNLDRINNIKL